MEDKTLYEREEPCPHCRKMVKISVVRKTIIEPTKGEYETVFSVTEAKQATIEESTATENNPYVDSALEAEEAS